MVCLRTEWPIAVCLGLALLLYWKFRVSGNPSVVDLLRVLWFDAGLVVRDLAGSGAPLGAGLLARADQRRSSGSKLEKCGSHMTFSFFPFYFGFQDPLVQRRRTKLLLMRFQTTLSYQGASRLTFWFRGQSYRDLKYELERVVVETWLWSRFLLPSLLLWQKAGCSFNFTLSPDRKQSTFCSSYWKKLSLFENKYGRYNQIRKNSDFNSKYVCTWKGHLEKTYKEMH